MTDDGNTGVDTRDEHPIHPERRRQAAESKDGRTSQRECPPHPSTSVLRTYAQDERCGVHVGLAAASVVGRDHVRIGRNNQDAAAVMRAHGFSVAVVCDGCSSGNASEVGSKLAARFLAHSVPVMAMREGLSPRLADAATDALLAHLYRIASSLPPETIADTVASQLLFSFLCAVTDGHTALVFGVGDGVVWVDGCATVLDAGERNAPGYLGYRLTPGAHGGTLRAQVHHFGPAQRVCLGTDGLIPALGEVDGLFADDVVWRNPVQLQRRLTVLSRQNHTLTDDTSLVLVRA